MRPRASAFSRVAMSTAPAPSEICEEVPAVCTPSGPATALSWLRPSRVVSRRPSSLATWCVVPVGLPSSPRSGASTSTIWVLNRSSAHAWAARSWDRRPKASVSSRVMPHFWAMRSAPSNWLVHSYFSK